jgi:sigma-B regulation protein RsbU (phosphoserine phosphatase)
MATQFTARVMAPFQRLSRRDVAALAALLVVVVLRFLRLMELSPPQNGFLVILGLAILVYFSLRIFLWLRQRLLWSLRNRLIVAYVFIAVVPVLLLLTMAGLAAYLLYWQLGSYVLYSDIQERIERVSSVATTMATSFDEGEAESEQNALAKLELPDYSATFLESALTELPGLKVAIGNGVDLLRRPDGKLNDRFAGLVLDGDVLTVRAVVLRRLQTGQRIVTAYAPITPELLNTFSPELGPVRFDIVRTRAARGNADVAAVIRVQQNGPSEAISTESRTIPHAANIFDKLITGPTNLQFVEMPGDEPVRRTTTLLATFTTRPSLLNHWLFSPLGTLGGTAATALIILGGFFLVIEIGSLITGIVLTRTITTSIDDLYRATQHVQSGDLQFRVEVKQKDQLAALAESFNTMTASVSTLVEEQRQRQRLENELSIAREVQLQLFPHTLPKIAGVELEAICRAARVVSGDYYDFIRISPTRLALALADISGKGISAALLMANVQAVLRSDVLRYRSEAEGQKPVNTAEIISHLNAHLFRNTSDERYATCFLAVYDAKTRLLTYTNAGHLPPLYIFENRVERLETGGMVVGLFDGVPYEQGTVEIDPGGVLIAYSDGLIEPENKYGEEFGTARLIEVALRNQSASPQELAEALMQAAREWTGSPAEQADDMTVVVSRFSHTTPEVRA